MDSVQLPHPLFTTMDLTTIRRIISEENLIDHDAMKAQVTNDVAKIVADQSNKENNTIDFTNATVVTSVLCEAISKVMTTTTQFTVPGVVSACVRNIKDVLKDEIKNEIKSEIMGETREFVKESVELVNESLTARMVNVRSDCDKLEAQSRRPNLVFSGIEEDVQERRNPSITAGKIVSELNDVGCDICIEDLSSVNRLYRKNKSNPAPNVIVARFVSQQVRDRVLSYQTTFNGRSDNKYLNEDMTKLQRNMFSYLRNREDVVIKRTVGFKDGHIIYLLKRNEHVDKGWSKVRNISDLIKLDSNFTDELSNDDFLKAMELLDCKVNIDLE